MEIPEVKMVTIGQYHMSLASCIVLAVGLTFSIVILFALPNVFGLIMGSYILLSVVLIAYNINCVQLGHCKIWAWVLTAVYIFGVVSSMLMYYNKSQNK
jgi:hypothetical protein